MGEQISTSLCLFGAPPDSGNLGVSALGMSVIDGIAQRAENADITVFDYGKGYRRGSHSVDGRVFEFSRVGAYPSYRFYRPENIWNLRFSCWLGGLRNRGAMAILRSRFALDISGGDSFTDLYGWRRFQGVSLRKSIVLEQGVKLILLPQTYGPFQTKKSRRAAEEIIRKSTMAWARDPQSFDVLKDLCGRDFDPARHRCGVDVAFGLQPRKPMLPNDLMNRLTGERVRPLVGLNVSGLIYNDWPRAKGAFGFRADYCHAIRELVRRLLADSDADVLLIPHVLGLRGSLESDGAACDAVANSVSDRMQRITVIPHIADAAAAKWIISRCDWFCGTRMHSTIAALSSGVPTAAIAYSMKTAGVFETCGQGRHVVDPRSQNTEELVDRLWDSWQRRRETKLDLAARFPQVREQARMQMDQIVEVCTGRKSNGVVTGTL